MTEPEPDDWGLHVLRDGHQRSLRGVTQATADTTIWTLPHGDHPEGGELKFNQPSSDGQTVEVTIWGDGGISVDRGTDWVRYDGIVFDAAYAWPNSARRI